MSRTFGTTGKSKFVCDISLIKVLNEVVSFYTNYLIFVMIIKKFGTTGKSEKAFTERNILGNSLIWEKFSHRCCCDFERSQNVV